MVVLKASLSVKVDADRCAEVQRGEGERQSFYAKAVACAVPSSGLAFWFAVQGSCIYKTSALPLSHNPAQLLAP